MDLLLTLGLFALGLVLVLQFAGRLVEGALGTARGFGLSAFFISVVFIGFDPENLAVGAVASYDGVAGIALGSIIGAAMVAIALAFGITALLTPIEFEQAPGKVLVLPIAAVVFFGLLSLDRRLSRLDGALLLAGYVILVLYVLHLSRRGTSVAPPKTEKIEEAEGLGRWKSLALLALSLAAIVVGSELVVSASEAIMRGLRISETLYGMTILALAVSIEELARELPAALRGRTDITFGNVVGSVFAFFLMNAGVIALVRPVSIPERVLLFHIPLALVTTVFIALVMTTRRVPRWAGGVLVALYVGFVAGSYLMASGPGAR